MARSKLFLFSDLIKSSRHYFLMAKNYKGHQKASYNFAYRVLSALVNEGIMESEGASVQPAKSPDKPGFYVMDSRNEAYARVNGPDKQYVEFTKLVDRTQRKSIMDAL
jgi:hypothetical protein